jgi:SagB-type dehydrogenase family enzyme
VFNYHDETKHHFHRFARSLGYLDWASQPHPFRYYNDAPMIRLEHVKFDKGLGYDDLYKKWAGQSEPFDERSLGDFFRHSLGLSAWKKHGTTRWSLRVNPSSGNLHPTEGYTIIGPMSGWSDLAGVYHYVSETHSLEVRCQFPTEVWESLMAGLPDSSFLVGLSSIHWREAWKYGERAFRYCLLDAGHAIATLRFAAALFGWNLQLLRDWPYTSLAAILGLDRDEDFKNAEKEEPELLALVTPASFTGKPQSDPTPEVIEAISSAPWFGKANQLSEYHMQWDLLDEVVEATRNPGRIAMSSHRDAANKDKTVAAGQRAEVDARQVILRRRSALAFDGKSYLALDGFNRILYQLMPGSNAPWDVLNWRPTIHLIFFVHRVETLPQGMYFLVREPGVHKSIRSATSDKFLWEKPENIQKELPFFLLHHGDCRDLAARVSCNQEIAGDSYFSLGMLAELATSLQEYGACFYRNLHWEAGLVGQVLYLEAEAIGARSTGIGCYFDDPVHQVLGLEGHDFQDLYHFTVGIPVDDPRLTTLPPYPEENL